MGNRSLTVCVMFSILFLGSFSAPLPFMQSSDQLSSYQILPQAFAVGKSFDQCKTGKDTRDACIDWIGSILQQQNSEYREGDGVRERLLLNDLAGDGGDKKKHTLDFSHQARKGGINAYDWLAGWDQYPPLTADGFNERKCLDLNPTFSTICNEPDSYTVVYDTADWPVYPPVGLLDVDSKIKALPGPIVPAFDVHADGITGAQITSVTYNGGDTAYWQYTLEWQTTGDTEEVAIFFAGHLAITGDGSNGTWSLANGGGSSNINGGPYHFKGDSADGESTGSIDNQIKGSDIVIDPCVDFMDDGLFCNGLETCDPADGSTIPGTAPVCSNGLFCDGEETCNEDTDMCDPGTAPVCSNGLFCDGDETCNEDTDMCDPGTAPVCDNGLFCDGDETCNEDTDMCDPGTAPVCGDGVSCTEDSCNEDTDMCESIPDDGACMDDNMCTVGSCDEILGCVQTNICPGDFTFTQGGWGAPPHGMNPGTVREICFANIGPLNVGSDSGHSLTFIGSTNVENFLPSGGKPGVLTQDQLNPVGKTTAGVFAGQTVALALNVACSDVPVNPPWEGPIGNFEVIDVNSICFGLTVDEVLAAAEEVLGGEPSGIPAIDNAKVSELSECVAAINENFNDGGDKGFLGLP